jgi:hypothetical protein
MIHTRKFVFIALLGASLILAACGTPAVTQDAPTATLIVATFEPTEAPLPGDFVITGPDELAAALAEAGYETQVGIQEAIFFFDMSPQFVKANDAFIDVYPFVDEAAALTAASTIPELLATTRWDGPPHFFHKGSVIVFYKGSDMALVNTLASLLGPEIAGGVPSDGSAESVSEVLIYFVALEDNGVSGDVVGCQDSIVPVTVQLDAPSASPIEAALTKLFSIKEQNYGESGFYNALYQSDLVVESATVENGLATVYLTGQFALGGVCDNPRFQAQLEYTVLQFPGIEAVQIFINNTPLQELLSGQG